MKVRARRYLALKHTIGGGKREAPHKLSSRAARFWRTPFRRRLGLLFRGHCTFSLSHGLASNRLDLGLRTPPAAPFRPWPRCQADILAFWRIRPPVRISGLKLLLDRRIIYLQRQHVSWHVPGRCHSRQGQCTTAVCPWSARRRSTRSSNRLPACSCSRPSHLAPPPAPTDE